MIGKRVENSYINGRIISKKYTVWSLLQDTTKSPFKEQATSGNSIGAMLVQDGLILLALAI